MGRLSVNLSAGQGLAVRPAHLDGHRPARVEFQLAAGAGRTFLRLDLNEGIELVGREGAVQGAGRNRECDGALCFLGPPLDLVGADAGSVMPRILLQRRRTEQTALLGDEHSELALRVRLDHRRGERVSVK